MKIRIPVTAAIAVLVHSYCLADGNSWKVKPDFENQDAARQISGAVCPGEPGSKKWCIAVNDEKKYIQFFGITGRKIVPGARARLLERERPDGTKWDEPDMEAVAYGDGFVYVAGSHGLARHSDDVQASRFFVFRLPVDPASGKPLFRVTRDVVAPEIIRTDRLRDLIRHVGVLSPFAEKPLGENGANIEGMGVRDGRLFFGFRAPSDRDGAVILDDYSRYIVCPASALMGHFDVIA